MSLSARPQPSFEELIHPDDRKKVMKLIDEAVEIGQPTNAEWGVVCLTEYLLDS